MALTALTRERMLEVVTAELEPGEKIRACAFGLWMPMKETTRKVLLYGLLVIGLFILLFLRDKVFVALTDRRLIVLVLDERTYRPIGQKVLIPIEAAIRVTHAKGSVYHELVVTTLTKPFRFLFSPSPLGLGANGAEVLAIHEGSRRVPRSSGPEAEKAARSARAVRAPRRHWTHRDSPRVRV